MKIYTFNMSEVELCTQPLGVHSLSTFYYKTLWLLISSDLIIIRCIDKEWWKYIYNMSKYIFTMSKVELWTQPLDVTSLSTFFVGWVWGMVMKVYLQHVKVYFHHVWDGVVCATFWCYFLKCFLLGGCGVLCMFFTTFFLRWHHIKYDVT